MKIALLQEERYLPSFHGSNKSNRSLLESLVEEGHSCLALCSVILRDMSREDLKRDLARRDIQLREEELGLYSYCYRGVQVCGMPHMASHAERSEFINSELARFDPDVVLVSSSGHSYLLAAAIRFDRSRTIYLAHGHHDLPFGPQSRCLDHDKLNLLRVARAVITVSKHSQEYFLQHAGIETVCLQFPVYGCGPHPKLGSFDHGCVTLIKSSASKGVEIFLSLAASFPEQQFAALRWDASDEALSRMSELNNVQVWEPCDDIEDILRRTKILLVPSIEPETFGLVVPEAMVRGIPVLASNKGGLGEAKLGVDYLLPIEPDLLAWREVLSELLTNEIAYNRCADASRAAAFHFIAGIDVRAFEDLFRRIHHLRALVGKPTGQLVAVVDPFDAGYLLAQELVRRGNRCVCVISSEYIDPEIVAKGDAQLFVQTIAHRGDASETAALLHAQGISCVLPGCETGVNVFDALTEALSFCSNGTALSLARRNKFVMAQAAAEKGIVIPAQFYSERLESLIAWVHHSSRWPVVVKPAQSLASDDVRICRSETDIADAFQSVVGKRNIAGEMNRGLIVQELMNATQYVVDTATYAGQHYLSGIWRYGQPEFAPEVLRALASGSPRPVSAAHLSWASLRYGAISSVSKQILEGEGSLAEMLFDYSCQVLDALGIRYGPCHFELMLTEDGIRLVEVGARVHGAPQTHVMNRMCTGTSQVDQTIDIFLDPATFQRRARRSYKLLRHGMMCRLMPWREGVLRAFRGLDRLERLPSFHGTFVMAEPGRRVPGCVGVAILLHPDEAVLLRDCEIIRQLEKEDLYWIEEQ